MDEIYKVSTKFRQITGNTFEFNFFQATSNPELVHQAPNLTFFKWDHPVLTMKNVTAYTNVVLT